MAARQIKRVVWVVLIGALLTAGSLRAWEWLQPQQAFGPERFAPYVYTGK